jgi:hypothetical protein
VTPAKRAIKPGSGRVAKKAAAKVEEPELLPDQNLLDAIDVWKAANQTYTDAYNAKVEAQKNLVKALRDLGVTGLNL